MTLYFLRAYMRAYCHICHAALSIILPQYRSQIRPGYQVILGSVCRGGDASAAWDRAGSGGNLTACRGPVGGAAARKGEPMPSCDVREQGLTEEPEYACAFSTFFSDADGARPVGDDWFLLFTRL